ncbi:hypothetical protein ACWCQ0_47755, partial [Streptomyces massasporeus]
ALIEALHLGLVPFERRHELTPVLFRVSADGDPVALSLVHRLAEEVVALSAVALGRLGLLEEEAPVMLGGSVLAARHPQLEERIRELLAERAPKAVIGFVTAPPVLGAAPNWPRCCGPRSPPPARASRPSRHSAGCSGGPRRTRSRSGSSAPSCRASRWTGATVTGSGAC